MDGIVRMIIPRRHFGFIKGTDNVEYFFHREDFNGFYDDLESDYNKQDVSVTFDTEMLPKGPRARNVRRTDFPNQAV